MKRYEQVLIRVANNLEYCSGYDGVGPLNNTPLWLPEDRGDGNTFTYQSTLDVIKYTKEFLHTIPSLKDCAGLDELISKMICDPGYSATQYTVHKIPKKSGGMRTIEAPSPLLKRVQRAILDAWLYPFFPISLFATGFVPHRGIKINAERHFREECKNHQVVLKMDMHNFFPSIHLEVILEAVFKYYKYCCSRRSGIPLPNIESFTSSLIDYRKGMAKVNFWGELPAYAVGYGFQYNLVLRRLTYGLVKLCMLDERLPQGAPTSPALSNLALMGFDNCLKTVLDRVAVDNAVYTRYADDMIITTTSVKDALLAKLIITRAVQHTGFLVINPDKTQILCNHLPQKITGININDKLSVSRWKRDKLRAEMHNLITGKHQLAGNQMAKISGYRAFMRGVDQEGWDSRCEKQFQQLKLQTATTRLLAATK